MQAPAQSDWKNPAALSALVGTVFLAGVYLTQNIAPLPPSPFEPPGNTPVPTPGPGRIATWKWDAPLSAQHLMVGWVTDVYSTTNFKTFSFVGFTTRSSFALNPTKVFEGFVIRHRNTNTGAVTEWNVVR